MAIFVVLWSYLLTTKLNCLQKNNFGHTNIYTPALSWTISIIQFFNTLGFICFSWKHKSIIIECYFRFVAFFVTDCLVSTYNVWSQSSVDFFFLSGSWGPITSLPVLWSSAESNERVSFLATFEHLSPFAASFTSHVMGLDMFCKKCFLAVI